MQHTALARIKSVVRCSARFRPRRMTARGQTAKNSRKALTSELPPITDMVRPRGNALRLPTAAKPLRAASGQIAFGFGKKSRMGGSRFPTADPETLRDGRWSIVGGLAGYVASYPGHRCTSHSQARGGTAADDACGRSHDAARDGRRFTRNFIPQSVVLRPFVGPINVSPNGREHERRVETSDAAV